MLLIWLHTVRLGKSGLKVSKLILGCMSYGTPEWANWILEEKESIEQIRYACVLLSFVSSVII